MACTHSAVHIYSQAYSSLRVTLQARLYGLDRLLSPMHSYEVVAGTGRSPLHHVTVPFAGPSSTGWIKVQALHLTPQACHADRREAHCGHALQMSPCAMQAGVQLFARMLSQTEALPGGGEPLAAAVQSHLDFARAHRDVIFKWGRFPHRNKILGRQSTEEEEQGMKDKSIPSF